MNDGYMYYLITVTEIVNRVLEMLIPNLLSNLDKKKGVDYTRYGENSTSIT